MIERAIDWFASRSWTPFEFQERAWRAYLDGRSGLVHAPTGLGKSLAVWLGPVLEFIAERAQCAGGAGARARVTDAPSLGADSPTIAARPGSSRRMASSRDAAEPIRVLWITPLRALAADTAASLLEPVRDLGLPWTVETRTGDTPQSMKQKQRRRLPTALVTTPESLSLLLSYPDARDRLGTLRCVIVDEWHELMGTKRGIQTELALARLRAWNPALRTWGLSATLGNLEEAARVLMGSPTSAPAPPTLIHAALDKQIDVHTLIPTDIERFPWSGHIGLRLLPQVIDVIAGAKSTLLFTNTRSQSEIWFRSLVQARPEWLGTVAIHHGSIDHAVRGRVESMLKSGVARCVVCTSSLDLGVDFSPVDQVIQVGSPKGVARLMQRAGRSGHQPGAISRIICVPTHAFELLEFTAARDALRCRRVESREPLDKPIDVLAQHLVTIAMGGGFDEPSLKQEVRATRAFASLSDEEWTWVMDFVRRGGPTLGAYPQFARVIPEPGSRWTVASRNIASMHRMNIGTIASDTMMRVQFVSGRTLGTIEESFISRLNEGDVFVFSGRVVELLRVRDMTALVRRSSRARGIVPVWGGGRMPLSSQLSDAVRSKLDDARLGRYDGPEMQAIRPLLELQAARSRIPAPDQLLVERVDTADGEHVIIMPFEGRLVHEGIAALAAHRLSRLAPISVHATSTDYGFDLHTPPGTRRRLDINESVLRRVLSPDNLLDDLRACLNTTQMARRRFRDVARVAGLLVPGYPGQRKPARHLQASSDMFFDVFEQFDPSNLLLWQSRREVLDDQLEIKRLQRSLVRISGMTIVMHDTERLSPLAFPVWAEVLRGVHATTESWSQRVARISEQLEALEAGEHTNTPPAGDRRRPARISSRALASRSRTRRSRRASA
ncbi:MAG: ligase-associated DNA damage response DEXH box helicase [Phycisphaerales bacterium]